MANRGTMETMIMNDGAGIGVYHVEPDGERLGGLVLIQEIFGVTDHIRNLCDQYAEEGFEVLSPAIFDREVPGLQAPYSDEGIQQALRIAREQHPFDQSVHDAQSCINALKNAGPVFMVGYCYGGSVCWAAACRCDGLTAVSGYYGSLVPKLNDEQPKCPTILHFGKHDAGIPLEGVEKVRDHHPDVPVYLYDAGHGFNSDRPTHYDRPSAELAKQRTLNLFRSHLKRD